MYITVRKLKIKQKKFQRKRFISKKVTFRNKFKEETGKRSKKSMM